jgi:hypothetical protein
LAASTTGQSSSRGAFLFVSKEAAPSLHCASHLFDHPVGLCYVPEVRKIYF